jgi:methionyl-tRNA formyltransferase
VVAPLRIVFFGTPAFAVPSLEALAASGHIIAGVVTQPDRPRGRGHRVHASEVKMAALTVGADVLQPARLRETDFRKQLTELEADLGVVAAYGRILPADILSIPRLGMINVHASLLPRWRGAAPVHRAILAGDVETGVTIMRVVQQLDAGPMIAKVSTPIDPLETSAALESRLAALGAALLVKTVASMSDGSASEIPQDETMVTYAARLEKHESAFSWDQPATMIHNRIRGLQPWPLAAALLHGRRVLLRSSQPLVDQQRDVAPGTVLRADAEGIVVAAAPGAVCLLELQLEGRPSVSASAFLNGHQLKPGDFFEAWTPASK